MYVWVHAYVWVCVCNSLSLSTRMYYTYIYIHNASYVSESRTSHVPHAHLAFLSWVCFIVWNVALILGFPEMTVQIIYIERRRKCTTLLSCTFIPMCIRRSGNAGVNKAGDVYRVPKDVATQKIDRVAKQAHAYVLPYICLCVRYPRRTHSRPCSGCFYIVCLLLSIIMQVL